MSLNSTRPTRRPLHACSQSLMLVAILVQSTITPAATAPTKPSTSISQPVPQNTLSLISKPTIQSLSPSGCYRPGDRFSLLGKGFGQSGSGIVIGMTAAQVNLNLQIVAWSDGKIDVVIPNKQLASNISYSIGLRKSDGTVWLSNQIGGVQICPAAAVPKVMSKGLTPPQSQPNIGAAMPEQWQEQGQSQPASEGWTDQESYNNQTPSTERRASQGSLLTQGLPPAPVFNAQQQHDTEAVEPGEVLLVSDSMASAQQAAARLSGAGLSVIRRNQLKNLGLVLSTFRLPPDMLVADALNMIRAEDQSLWLDANSRFTLQGSTDQRYAFKLIKWPVTTSQCGKGVRVGLVDAEVDKRHALLKSARMTGKSFIPNGVKPAQDIHGTLLGSLLVGRGGLIPRADLYSAGVFRRRDKGSDTTSEILIKALDWLLGEKVKVINLSLGGPRNLILEAALTQVMRQGVIVVAAAGNNGPDAEAVYPAAQDGVIAVTAIDARLHIYDKANQGDYIGFAAPGVDLELMQPNGQLHYYSGTSYAAPFVTAAVASLYRDKQTPAQLIQRMVRQSKDLGDKGRDKVYGQGLIQAGTKCPF